MTQRHKLENHRLSLQEIREIMNSMKTLSYMETRKLARFIESQQAVVQNIEEVAIDFLGFHPGTLPPPSNKSANKSLYILIGAERGFCGDYNHTLLTHFDSIIETKRDERHSIMAVGRKLNTLLEHNEHVLALFDGASVAEEVPALIQRIVTELVTAQEQHNILTIYCLFHANDHIVTRQLSPPFEHLLSRTRAFSVPPILNITPDEFILELTEHYLFSALYEIVYTSLLQENHHRVIHLEGAIKHLDDESTQLAQQCNVLRQEEIIEEIEVILLSAESITQGKQITNKPGSNQD